MKVILKAITCVGQQHINHSALVSFVTKQSAIFSVLSDDPNLPVSPLVPADSNKAGERVVFSSSHFFHQHNSIALERGMEVREGAVVCNYLLQPDVLSNTVGFAVNSEHISTWC